MGSTLAGSGGLWLVCHNLVHARHCSKSLRNFNSLNSPAAVGEKHAYDANDGEGN